MINSYLNNDILNFLREIPLLNKVPKDVLENISMVSTIKDYKKGSIIYKKGDPSNWIYFILSGHVAEFVSYNSSVEIIVKTRKRLDYIGEMGILADKPYPNTAIALEKVTLVAFSEEKFMELTLTTSSILQYINRELIDRLVNSSINAINAMYLDATGRLAFALVNLAIDKGGHNNDTIINITQSELASTAGMARQTASILLEEWRENCILETLRGCIKIKDINRLMDIIINSELK
ncbi:MAG: Crp/Fnr family transcriptional regulator [Sedimentibacter saalensis]|uniref:Crp/Fnr family transcriptional regulator n=1 Tax=Sedimentibacter saalensis TaxID=130788 RepID=UPI002B1F3633|nr:Crp/Fnr family transcriptional regulator [Sedimentibacter saalensis]MEA5094110.1 Crp/Fnr family transcriptional regulator [Sedimentibacter saalensis]